MEVTKQEVPEASSDPPPSVCGENCDHSLVMTSAGQPLIIPHFGAVAPPPSIEYRAECNSPVLHEFSGSGNFFDSVESDVFPIVFRVK